jgi:hypothetical protein
VLYQDQSLASTADRPAVSLIWHRNRPNSHSQAEQAFFCDTIIARLARGRRRAANEPRHNTPKLQSRIRELLARLSAGTRPARTNSRLYPSRARMSKESATLCISHQALRPAFFSAAVPRRIPALHRRSGAGPSHNSKKCKHLSASRGVWFRAVKAARITASWDGTKPCGRRIALSHDGVAHEAGSA